MTHIVGAYRSSRKARTVTPYPFAHGYSAARVDRASAPPKLHRQHFARSSYRCGIRLTGNCNSIFKDEHPNSYRLLRPCSQSELCTSRRSAHFGDRGPGQCRRFLPTRTEAPLASDIPIPLPRRRVNDAGFNASSRHLRSARAAASPPPACASTSLARRNRRQPRPTTRFDEHDDSHRLLQSIRGPSTLANDSLPGAPPLFTAKRCTSRCDGDAKPHRPFRCRVSAVLGTEAGYSP